MILCRVKQYEIKLNLKGIGSDGKESEPCLNLNCYYKQDGKGWKYFSLNLFSTHGSELKFLESCH